ncbi:hypothetical protein DFH09DRAFT_1357899 [Mycena vulgaris]|nr:hypothetical protein DFH09DRAFT_1357899 [Mycena vulgaris]
MDPDDSARVTLPGIRELFPEYFPARNETVASTYATVRRRERRLLPAPPVPALPVPAPPVAPPPALPVIHFSEFGLLRPDRRTRGRGSGGSLEYSTRPTPSRPAPKSKPTLAGCSMFLANPSKVHRVRPDTEKIGDEDGDKENEQTKGKAQEMLVDPEALPDPSPYPSCGCMFDTDSILSGAASNPPSKSQSPTIPFPLPTSPPTSWCPSCGAVTELYQAAPESFVSSPPTGHSPSPSASSPALSPCRTPSPPPSAPFLAPVWTWTPQKKVTANRSGVLREGIEPYYH